MADSTSSSPKPDMTMFSKGQSAPKGTKSAAPAPDMSMFGGGKSIDRGYFSGFVNRYAGEVGNAVDRLKRDFKTITSPATEYEKQPAKMANYFETEALPPETAEKLQASDRFLSDIIDVPKSVLATGPIRALTNTNSQDANALLIGVSGLSPATEGAAGTVARVGGAGADLARTSAKRVASGSAEAANRVRLGWGHERGTEPTPEQRQAGRADAVEGVRRLANRLDPTGQKLLANPVEARGKPITAAEALGKAAEVRLKVLGRRMGQTPEALESQLRERDIGTPDRLLNDYGRVAGLDPAEIHGDFTAQAAKLRAKAAPLYEQAYQAGPVNNETLQGLLGRDAVKKALARAVRIASNEGRKPNEIGIVRREVELPLRMKGGDQLVHPVTKKPLTYKTTEPFEVQNPTMQTWDYIKRGLDDELEGYRDKTTGKLNLDTEGRSVQSVLKELRGELTNPETHWGPKYAAALDAGGEPLRLEEAYKGAGSLMSNNTSEAQFSAATKTYSASQKEALKAGMVQDAMTRARAGRQRINELLSPTYKAKLTQILGPEKAQELIQLIQDERILKTRGARMTPGIGSDTSEAIMGNQDRETDMREVGKILRHVSRGKWGSALIDALVSPVAGAVRGAQLPISEAARDFEGELLMGRPSVLAQILRDQGATPAQASEVVGEIKRAGLLSRQRVTPVLAGALAGSYAQPNNQGSK